MNIFPNLFDDIQPGLKMGVNTGNHNLLTSKFFMKPFPMPSDVKVTIPNKLSMLELIAKLEFM